MVTADSRSRSWGGFVLGALAVVLVVLAYCSLGRRRTPALRAPF